MQGGSPGRVVTGDDSWQEVVGLNPSTGYLMDIFCINLLLQKLYCLFKNNEKEAGMAISKNCSML